MSSQSLTAEVHINNIHVLLGRSHTAGLYSSLTKQQKAMVLFGAKLKPSEYMNMPLDEMTFDEREQIRLSIIALREISNVFGLSALDKERFSKCVMNKRAKRQA